MIVLFSGKTLKPETPAINDRRKSGWAGLLGVKAVGIVNESRLAFRYKNGLDLEVGTQCPKTFASANTYNHRVMIHIAFIDVAFRTYYVSYFHDRRNG